MKPFFVINKNIHDVYRINYTSSMKLYLNLIMQLGSTNFFGLVFCVNNEYEKMK